MYVEKQVKSEVNSENSFMWIFTLFLKNTIHIKNVLQVSEQLFPVGTLRHKPFFFSVVIHTPGQQPKRAL